MSLDANWGVFFVTIVDFLQRNAIGILISISMIFVVGRIVVGLANKYVQPEEKQLAIRKWARYITVSSAIIWVLILYYSYTHSDTPFFLFIVGLVLAGIAFSMREALANAVGWMVIISEKGFKQGDRIQIDNLAGDVLDIGIFRTIIAEIGQWVGADQSTGRLVSVPNSKVLNHEIHNYMQGFEFIWDELKILVTFESDWKIAEKIMLEAAMADFKEKEEQIRERLKRVRRRYLIRLNFITPKVYVKVADSGVELTLRYLVRPRRRRTMADDITREILARIDEKARVEFAYPTTRFFTNGESSGKPLA